MYVVVVKNITSSRFFRSRGSRKMHQVNLTGGGLGGATLRPRNKLLSAILLDRFGRFGVEAIVLILILIVFKHRPQEGSWVIFFHF